MDKRRARRFASLQEEIIPEISLPHIDLDSDKSALIDGCAGVVEYDEKIVRINCGRKIVKFIGCDLSIKALSVSRICVSGKIFSVEFCE